MRFYFLNVPTVGKKNFCRVATRLKAWQAVSVLPKGRLHRIAAFV